MVDRYVDKKMRHNGVLRAPEAWPRNMNVPIVMQRKDTVPMKGEWERIGMDIIVFSVFRGLALARKSSLPDHICEGFLRLLQNVVFDFVHCADNESVMLISAQLKEDHEELREFFGLDCIGMLQLVGGSMKIIEQKTPGKEVDGRQIHDYLARKIVWASQQRVPSPEKCTALSRILDYSANAPIIGQIMQMSRATFGTTCLFNEMTKLMLISQRAKTANECGFVFSGIWTEMVRYESADPFSCTELRSKTGPISRWIFLRQLFRYWKIKFVFTATENCSQEQINIVWDILENPVTWLEQALKTDVPTWPLALRCLFELGGRLMGGQLNSVLKGFLGHPPQHGSHPEDFLELKRMQTFSAELTQRYYVDYLGKEHLLAGTTITRSCSRWV